MFCKSCDFESPKDFKFCPECGQKPATKVRCPSCQNEEETIRKFCGECGHHFAQKPDHEAKTPQATDLGFHFYDKMHESFHRRMLDCIDQLHAQVDIHSKVRFFTKNKLETELAVAMEEVLQETLKFLPFPKTPTSYATLKENVEPVVRPQLEIYSIYLNRLQEQGQQVLSKVTNSASEGIFRSLKVGLTSEDCAWGAAAGSIFPGVGNIIGAGIGGYIAGKKRESEQQSLVESYTQAVQDAADQFDKIWLSVYSSLGSGLAKLYNVKALSAEHVQQTYAQYNSLIKQADSHFELGEFESAIAASENAIRALPRESYPHLLSGVCLFSLERYELAIEAFIQGLALPVTEPDFKADSLIHLGSSYRATGKMGDAIEAFKGVVTLERSNLSKSYISLALHHLARCFAMTGQTDEALRSLEEAIDEGLLTTRPVTDLLNDGDFEGIVLTDGFSQLLRSPSTIKSIIVSHLTKLPKIEYSRFSVGEEIESIKLQNAKSTYSREKPDETVICLFDSTVFGSAKAGLCFTERTIFWQSHYQEPFSAEFTSIKSLEINGKVLLIDGKPFESLSPPAWTLSLLQDITAAFNHGVVDLDSAAAEHIRVGNRRMAEGTLDQATLCFENALAANQGKLPTDKVTAALYGLCCVLALQGELGAALKRLTEAVEEGLLKFKPVIEIVNEPVLKELRRSPTFAEIFRSETATRSIIQRHIEKLSPIEAVKFRPPEFNLKKLKNAEASYIRKEPGESIMCFYDSTVFGSAKEGICFTDRSFYWKGLWQKPGSARYIGIDLQVKGKVLKLNAEEFSEYDINWTYSVLQEVGLAADIKKSQPGS